MEDKESPVDVDIMEKCVHDWIYLRWIWYGLKSLLLPLFLIILIYFVWVDFLQEMRGNASQKEKSHKDL